jgi:predicted nucleic acid-binding protein
VKVALDTNILCYAEGLKDPTRRDAAINLVQRLPEDAVVIPVQALGELFRALVRKAGRSRGEARDVLLTWRDAFTIVDTSSAIMVRAADLATDHQLGIWDALMLASAAASGCRLLLSEDLQHGFTWGGLTVVNPFDPTGHPLLEALLLPADGDSPVRT